MEIEELKKDRAKLKKEIADLIGHFGAKYPDVIIKVNVEPIVGSIASGVSTTLYVNVEVELSL